jgi:hypothetical protein
MDEHNDDPTVLNYYIVKTSVDSNDKYSCRLIGVVPNSDSFGADVVTDEYNEIIK